MYSYNGYGQNYGQNIQPDLTPSPAEKRSIRRLYNSVGISMIVQYILSYAVVFAAMIFWGGSMEEQYSEDGTRIVGFAEAAVMFCAAGISSIITYIGYNLIHRVDMGGMFKVKGISGRYILGSVCAVLLFHEVGIILEYGVAIVLAVFGLDTPDLNFELVNDAPTTFMNVFTSVILAPIAEELFFRGVVLKQLARVSGRFAIIISAVMFGLMHGNPYQAVMAFLIGLVLGYITIETDSVVPAIICHMAVNTMASVTDIVYYFDSSLADSVSYMVGVLEFVIGAVGFALILRSSKIKLPPYTEYHKKRTLPLMLTSVGMLIIFAVYIYDIVTSVQPVEETEEFVETAARIFIGQPIFPKGLI